MRVLLSHPPAVRQQRQISPNKGIGAIAGPALPFEAACLVA